MIDEKLISMSDLREGCAALNKSGLLDEPLKVVGIKKMTLVERFAGEIEKLAEAGLEEEVPIVAKDFYNTVFEDEFIDKEAEGDSPDETEEPEKEDKPEKKEKKEKKDKPAKKEKKEKKEVPSSIFGHRANTQAATLDDAFAKGASYEKAAELAGVKPGRARGHLKHLEDDIGLKVKEIKEGVFKVSK